MPPRTKKKADAGSSTVRKPATKANATRQKFEQDGTYFTRPGLVRLARTAGVVRISSKALEVLSKENGYIYGYLRHIVHQTLLHTKSGGRSTVKATDVAKADTDLEGMLGSHQNRTHIITRVQRKKKKKTHHASSPKEL